MKQHSAQRKRNFDGLRRHRTNRSLKPGDDIVHEVKIGTSVWTLTATVVEAIPRGWCYVVDRNLAFKAERADTKRVAEMLRKIDELITVRTPAPSEPRGNVVAFPKRPPR